MNGVTGMVLAGGQGRRMGGVDKGLQLLHGKPMVAAVIARLAPQVDEILINANQNLADYERFGHRVVPDAIGGFAGPLAGLHAGLGAARHAFVLTVPCDSPFLPLDLFSRCRTDRDKDLAVAKTEDQSRILFLALVRHGTGKPWKNSSPGRAKMGPWYRPWTSRDPFDEAEAFRTSPRRGADRA